MLVMVTAQRMGYFDHKRQREGDKFMMEREDAEKCSWVEIDEVQPQARVQTASKGRGGIKAPLANPVVADQKKTEDTQSVI